MESVTDYRRLAHHHRGLFFTDDCKEEELQARFKEVAAPHPTRPLRVDVIMGRTLDVAQAGKSLSHAQSMFGAMIRSLLPSIRCHAEQVCQTCYCCLTEKVLLHVQAADCELRTIHSAIT